MSGLTYGKFPHSTGFRPLQLPLPRKRQQGKTDRNCQRIEPWLKSDKEVLPGKGCRVVVGLMDLQFSP